MMSIKIMMRGMGSTLFASITAPVMIIIGQYGMELNRSIKRINNVSTQLPKYPATPPMTTPMINFKENDHEADHQRDAAAVHQAGQHVHAVCVGTQ